MNEKETVNRAEAKKNKPLPKIKETVEANEYNINTDSDFNRDD